MEGENENSTEQRKDMNANDTNNSGTGYVVPDYEQYLKKDTLDLQNKDESKSATCSGSSVGLGGDGAETIRYEFFAMKIGYQNEENEDRQEEQPAADESLIDTNGLTFGEKNVYVSEELLQEVLSHVDVNSLKNLRDVCCNWRRLVEEPYFWKQVMKRNGRRQHWGPIFHHTEGRADAWRVFHADVKNHFLDQNLIRNPCGEDGFAGWTHMSGEVGGWTIDNLATQDQPPGIFKWPGAPSEGNVFCFGTNSFSCSKEQDVDLWRHGFTPDVMRACIPFAITWSEIVATPTACAGLYEAQVMLLDSALGPISPYSPYRYSVRQIIPRGSSWRPFQKRFVVDHVNAYEVCDDLRYIHVFHGAMEHEFITEGHWGPRMACSSITISLVGPEEQQI